MNNITKFKASNGTTYDFKPYLKYIKEIYGKNYLKQFKV